MATLHEDMLLQLLLLLLLQLLLLPLLLLLFGRFWMRCLSTKGPP